MSTADMTMSNIEPLKPPPQPRSLLNCLFDLLSDPDQGGLAVLIGNFHAAGLGEIMDSWASAGKNLPISAEQIRKGLGDKRIRELAEAAQLLPTSVGASLTELLPMLVSTLTPDGKLPSQKSLSHCLDFMRSRLLDH